MNTEPEPKSETAEQSIQEKSEGEIVLDLLRTFQSDLKTANEKNQALEQEIRLLNDKVNKELPAQLDRAFKDISDNFNAITRGLEAIPRAQQSTVAAAAAQKESSGIEGIIGRIIGAIEKGVTGGESGGLSEFDKQILSMTKQIQIITLKDVLRKSAKSAGIELAEHVVVNP